MKTTAIPTSLRSDGVDWTPATHYGFTAEDRDFTVNYDVKTPPGPR